MRLHLLHRTTFVYEGNARDSFNEARLRPSDGLGQTVTAFSFRTRPAAAVQEFTDYFGNPAHRFSISQPHSELVVEAESEVVTTPNEDRRLPPAVGGEPPAPDAFDDQIEFLQPSRYIPLDPIIEDAARQVLPLRQGVWTDVVEVSRYVHRSLVYRPQATGVETVASDALKLRAGVCQDFAHVTLGICRSAGLAARYVSGYFLNYSRPPGEPEASHAWIEAWVPGFGWTGYDPTHDRVADERYIRVATGRDYADIRPVSGTYRGLPTRELRVEVHVNEMAVTDRPA